MKRNDSITGRLKSLDIGKVARFDKNKCNQSYIRSVASTMKNQHGKIFQVNAPYGSKYITVTRIS